MFLKEKIGEMKKVGFFLFFSLLIFLSQKGLAQVEFYAQLSPTRLEVGERAFLTITLSGENIDTRVKINLPDLEPYFKVEGKIGPSFRTEVSIINGRMTKRTSFRVQYILFAQKAGKFTIPRISHRIGSKIYFTAPIEVEIIEPSQKGSQKGMLEKIEVEKDPNLVLELDKEKAYVGEQVVARWYLWYRRQLYDLSLGLSPSLKSFKVMELESVSQLSPTIKNVNGRAWYQAFIQSLALFPLYSGELSVGSLELRYQLPSPGGGFLAMPMMQERSVKSEPKTIKVLPLPQPAPKDFTGAVGKYEVKISANKLKLRTNDSFQLIVTISGDGNPDYILEPSLELPSSFEVYPPETKLETEVRAGRLWSTKKFRYIIMPRKQGRYEIPSVRFCYFDPESGTYKWAQSSSLIIEVIAGFVSPTQQAVGEEVRKKIPEEIRYIKPDHKVLVNQSGEVFGKIWFWLAHLLGLVFVGISLWWRSYQNRLKEDIAFARKERAYSRAKKNLKKARFFLQANNLDEFYGELKRILLDYFSDHFAISARGMVEEEMEEVMRKNGVSDELRKEFLSLLNELSRAQFARLETRADAHRLYERVEKVIADLEKS